MKQNYIKHGPPGFNKTIDTVECFVNFVQSLRSVEIDTPASWEFEVVLMTEEEFHALPVFEEF